jgi:hypothetical protein
VPEELTGQSTQPEPLARSVQGVERAPLLGSRAALAALIHHTAQVIGPRGVTSPVNLGLDLGEAVGADLGVQLLQALSVLVVVPLEAGIVGMVRVVREVLGQRGSEEVLVLLASRAEDVLRRAGRGNGRLLSDGRVLGRFDDRGGLRNGGIGDFAVLSFLLVYF